MEAVGLNNKAASLTLYFKIIDNFFLKYYYYIINNINLCGVTCQRLWLYDNDFHHRENLNTDCYLDQNCTKLRYKFQEVRNSLC
jgi:hypothetical protein